MEDKFLEPIEDNRGLILKIEDIEDLEDIWEACCCNIDNLTAVRRNRHHDCRQSSRVRHVPLNNNPKPPIV